MTSDEEQVVEAELAKPVKKNVISQVDHVVDESVSTIFLMPEKDGSNRLILNLKHLNKSIEQVHFKLDSLKSAIFLLKKKRDCYFASLDIRDAYFSIPVDESCRKIFRFCFQEKLFEFSGLPQG